MRHHRRIKSTTQTFTGPEKKQTKCWTQIGPKTMTWLKVLLAEKKLSCDVATGARKSRAGHRETGNSFGISTIVHAGHAR